MDEGDGDFFRRGGREDVTADLKESEGEGGRYDVSSWVADAVFECRDGGSDGREDVGEIGEEDAPGGNEGELN